jgi:SAM-dependent methyltransferase
MIKYFTTAVALRGFSATPITRRLYRKLGNEMGGKRRRSGAMPRYYVDRVERIVRLLRAHRLIRDGDRILELGTGWLHWEAITLRLLFDVEAVLFDVWDNRQLGGLKNYLAQLGPMLGGDVGLSAVQVQRAQSMIKTIVAVQSFDELYERLNFKYVIEPSGSLKEFTDGSFDLIVSGGVLEHVKRESVPGLIRETYRVLKPRGWALHSIDTSDHLSHYDASVSKKKYLTYSEPTWRVFFENEVQYINRLQRGQWLEMFRSAGFELMDEDSRQVDISDLKVAERYREMKPHDLQSTVVRLALRTTQDKHASD